MEYLKSTTEYLKSTIEYLEQVKTLGLTVNNSILIALILYISFISMYTPRHIISFINLPIIKIAILLLIIYTSTIDIKLTLLLTIAFLITINLEYSIQTIETKIENYETNKKLVNDIDSVDSEVEDEEESEDEEEEEEDDEGSEDGEEDDTSSTQSDENYTGFDKPFNIKDIKPAKNLDDNFTNLHKAMHKLTAFISKK